MMTASQIIADLGGPAQVARDTGFPLTTVDSWRSANFIPAWRQDTLLKLAKAKRIALALADFPVRRPTEQAERAA